MKNSHVIKINDNRVRYEFEIKRNITVIRGDSATGKTTLLQMLDTFVRLGGESGITMECDVPVDVYMFDDRRINWKDRLQESEGSIIFIEEMNTFIRTKEFAEYIAQSDSYFVLVTRWNLKNIPYSVKEIYKLVEKGKYPNTKQIYNCLEEYYSFETNDEKLDITKIITEDSGSGYDFYEYYCKKNKTQMTCESADGNSNVLGMIRNEKNGILCIADGSAFGGFIADCVSYLNYANKKCILWLPESFEYLILKSGIIKIPNLNEILENTSKFIDSKEFLSWERYFTYLVIENSKDTEYAYSKSELNDYYKSDFVVKRIEKQIPKGILRILQGIEE